MAALDKVMKMKERGMPEDSIVKSLRQEGFPPKEIHEALSQSKIKEVLTKEKDNESAQEEDSETLPYYSETQSNEPQSSQQEPAYEYAAEEQIAPPPQQYSPEQGGGYYQEYQPQQGGSNIETINDIAEQIVEEKTSEIKKKINSIVNFKASAASDIEKINKRLDKLENNFDALQAAILKKIGEYGDDIKNISKEMHSTQESFSKILDPLTDNIRELRELTGKESKDSQDNKNKKNSDEKEKKEISDSNKQQLKKKTQPNFEDYLR
jgi:hypothetical protein